MVFEQLWLEEHDTCIMHLGPLGLTTSDLSVKALKPWRIARVDRAALLARFNENIRKVYGNVEARIEAADKDQ